MGLPDPLYQVLYLSQLAPGVGVGVVKDIFQVSRARNPVLGVTGVLLFDGERFCQLLEGPTATLDPLLAQIERDARHRQVRVLHRGVRDAVPMRGWRTGYCGSVDDLDAFDGETPLDGPPAVTALQDLARGLDLD